MQIIEYFHKTKEKELQKENLFIGEGEFIVERMIQAGIPMKLIACTPTKAPDLRKITDCQVVEIDPGEWESLAGFRFHRGVMAIGERPVVKPAETFFRTNSSLQNIVILPEIRELENMGSILRSAAAFGIDAVLTGPRCCDPYSRKALRCSMGNIFTLLHLSWEEDEEIIALLKAEDYHLTGTSLKPGSIPLKAHTFRKKNGIVFGCEPTGMDQNWMNACQSHIKIEISKGVDSLNVGVAAGILLYALFQHRSL